MNKLPVFKSVGEVFSGVTRHYFQLIGVAWPAVAVLLISTGIYYWAYFTSGFMQAVVAAQGDTAAVMAAYGQLFSGSTGFLVAISTGLALLASAVAAVRWHRFVLLGDSYSPVLRGEDGRYVWTLLKVFASYVLAVLVLFFAVATIMTLVRGVTDGEGVAASLSAIVVSLGAFALYMVAFGIYLRLMLALPDAAIGQEGRVRTIFRSTRGNTWRLIGYIFLTTLVLVLALLIATIVAALVGGGLLLLGQAGAVISLVLGAAFSVAAYLYFVMLSVTMLSVAYREIVGLPGASQAEAAFEPAPAA